MEVGGIEKACLRNYLYPSGLQRIAKNVNDFQFLFGFVCLYIFLGVLTSTWHKYGTKL